MIGCIGQNEKLKRKGEFFRFALISKAGGTKKPFENTFYSKSSKEF